MAIDYDDLDREKFEAMGFRETVRGVPSPSYGTDTDSLTKMQVCTLVMIYDSGAGGWGQIRRYPERPSRRLRDGYMPSPSVPETLDEKGFADVGRRKQVRRRTGRGPGGFEKKTEGGYVNAHQSDDLLDELAEKLGFSGRFDDDLVDFVEGLLGDHPNA